MKSLIGIQIIFLLVLTPLISLASDDPSQDLVPQNVLLPSPTAAELGRYGEVPVGMFTGTPNVNIPLYTLNTKNFSIPLSLSYSSNGIKVDQVASNVGMGWSLNSGGVITRTVYSKADEDVDFYVPDNILDYRLEVYNFLQGCKNGMENTQPDVFAYNFNGNSGKFIINQDKSVLVIPHQKLQINPQIFVTDETQSKIIVITPDGVKYTFGGDATCIEESQQTSDCGRPYDRPHITAWYLRTMEHPTGELITFEYEPYLYSYLSSYSQTLVRTPSTYNVPEGCGSSSQINECESELKIFGKQLKRIISEGFGTVVINCEATRADLPAAPKVENIQILKASGELLKSFQFDYYFSNNSSYTNIVHTYRDYLKTRMFLTKLSEINSEDHEVRVHDFDYKNPDGLPARISFAQDHWGYFNGKNNLSLVPDYSEENPRIKLNNDLSVYYNDYFNDFTLGADKEIDESGAKTSLGLLTKVDYPTGGYIEIEYEPNTYRGSNTIAPTTTISCDTIGEFFRDIAEKRRSFTLPFDQTITVTGEVQLLDVIENYDPTRQGGYLSIYDVDNSVFTSFKDVDVDYGTDYLGTVSLTAGNYEFVVQSAGAISHTYGDLTYAHVEPYSVPANKVSPGMRVKETRAKESMASNEIIKHYYYDKFERREKSSGNVPIEPLYLTDKPNNLTCKDIFGVNIVVETFSLFLHSNSQISLIPGGNDVIFYEYVTESYGGNFENGGKETQFLIESDIQGRLLYGDDYILGCPNTNTSWNNGKMKSEKLFKIVDDIQIIQKETINNYVTDPSIATTVMGVITDVIPETYPYSYEDGSYLNVDDVIVMGYDYYSMWNYLSKTTNYTYDENGENPLITKTEYFYDNPVHTQPTRTINYTSIGDTLESRMFYPDDYSIADWNLSELKDGFFISLPIKTLQFKNSQLLGGKMYRFNTLGQIEYAYALNTNIPLSDPGHNPASLSLSGYTEEAHLVYDAATHNIQNIYRSNGLVESYLWGYDNKLPIAQAVSSSEADFFYTSFEEEVSNTSTDAKTGFKSHSGSYTVILPSAGTYELSYWEKTSAEWELKRATISANTSIGGSGKLVDEVRLYPIGAQMQSYTYDSPLGITGQSDVNGQVSTYEYDSFGRLKLIRDSEGNILQMNDYHYQNEGVQ